MAPVRRNVAKVKPAERAKLLKAILELMKRVYPGTREDPIPGGVTFWFKQDEIHQSTHVHGGPAFLPWHRELVNRFEALLQEIDPTVALHYWDWQTDPRRSPDGTGGFVNLFTPEFMGSADGDAGEPWLRAGFYNPAPRGKPFRGESVADPVNNNPFDPPQFLQRAVGREPLGTKPDNSPNLGRSDEEILAPQAFPEMRRRLEIAHNLAHDYIGGTIGEPHTAFRDPFIFLLHSNVDRLFASWQLRPGEAWRLDPERVYGEDTDRPGNEREPAIKSLFEPWAGQGVPRQPGDRRLPPLVFVRPWAPPENQQVMKDSTHPSVVEPPLYDDYVFGEDNISDFPIGSLRVAEGRLTSLQVGEIGSGFGPPDELVDAEVAIKLDSKRNKEFGFQLRNDDNKDANRGMLNLLRDAFNKNRSVVINYVRTGIRNGLVVRVEKPR